MLKICLYRCTISKHQEYLEITNKITLGECTMRKFTFITIALVLLAGLLIIGARSTVLAQDPQSDLTSIEALGKGNESKVVGEKVHSQACIICNNFPKEPSH